MKPEVTDGAKYHLYYCREDVASLCGSMPVVTEPQTEASRPSGWQYWSRLTPMGGVLRRV